MSTAPRLVRCLAALYPHALRRELGGELELFLEHQRREARYRPPCGGTLRFACEVGGDALASHGRRLFHAFFPSVNPPIPKLRGDAPMSQLLFDLRFAARSCRKNPGFTAVAVLTLALGVGANTAIFSVVHGVLLAPLDYPASERLHLLFHRALDGSYERGGTTPGNFADWRDGARSFESMAAFYSTTLTLTGDGDPRRVDGVRSVGSVLEVLGVEAAAGRVFTAADDVPEGDRVVVLSHSLASRLFGSAARGPGREVTLDGQPYAVIGVMPADFRFPGAAADFWMPVLWNAEFRVNRTEYWLNVIARLGEGATPAAARAEMGIIAEDLRRAFPQANSDVDVAVVPLAEELVAGVETRILILMGAVGFVLLMACLNLANLLLARVSGRRRELAVRRALGADRFRLAGQLLTESGLLALLGALAGIALGFVLLRGLLAFVPERLPRMEEIGLDAPVLVFAVFLALLSGLLVGLIPVLRLRPGGVPTALRAARSSGGDDRLRSGLVIVEVAVSVVLLIGAGLLLRSFQALGSVEPGFRTERILTARISLPAASYEGEERLNFFAELEERAAALPGVESAGMTSFLPVSGGGSGAWLNRMDRPQPEEQRPALSRYRVVTAGYFATLDIPLLRGRGLAPGDGAEGREAVIINRAAAELFWAGEEALGKELTLGPDGGWIRPSRIVGIVANVKNSGLGEAALPVVYMPYGLTPGGWPSMVVTLATNGDPLLLTSPLRELVRELDAGLAVYEVRSAEEILRAAVGPARSMAMLLGVFAAVALVMAALGVFGVLSYAVSQRTRELGIRLALGADAAMLRRMVVGQGVRHATVGVLVGLAAAFALARVLKGLLFGVSATDPVTFSTVALILVATAVIASLVPAWRATRIDPARVLQAD